MKSRCPNCDIRESLYCEETTDNKYCLRCCVCDERPSGIRHPNYEGACKELETMIEKEMARNK
jgi:hypothetical protein